MMRRNFSQKSLATTALCLAAGTFLNSCIISNIGGTCGYRLIREATITQNDSKDACRGIRV